MSGRQEDTNTFSPPAHSLTRFPTSLESDGSDAIHPDPDYSAVYVVIRTDNGHHGYGLAFTLGRGGSWWWWWRW